MGLTSVLVDRARVLRTAAQPVKLEGRTLMVDVEPGTWFECRLFLPASPESRDPGSVRKRVVIAPTLLFDLEDEDGNALEVRASDRLEVESEDLGSATWQVTGNPEPLRRKQGLIGWQVSLKRIDSPEFEAKI